MHKILCKHNSLPNPWSILPRETASNQSDTHNHFHGSETKTFANWCIWTSAQTVDIENCSCSRVSCKFVNIYYIYILSIYISTGSNQHWVTRKYPCHNITIFVETAKLDKDHPVKYGIAVGAQTTKHYCDAD